MEEDWERFIQESQPIQPTENENTYEKWWIYRGKNHSCSCGQTDHHSHQHCKKCHKIADNILAYPRCQCNDESEKQLSG